MNYKVLMNKNEFEVGKNFVFVVDVSGSMSGSLSKMRTHLKNNLAQFICDDDTISIIYFSGKGECGTIFTGLNIKDNQDLLYANKAIDKQLTPICLTGFVDPLQLAIKVSKDLPKINTNCLIMMTDGYDNVSNRKDILNVTEQLNNYYDEISFIEYGQYCDRDLIKKMSEQVGANHIFSEDYKDYETNIEKSFNSEGVKKVEVDVPINNGKVVQSKDDDLIVSSFENFKVLVPQNIEDIFIYPNDELKVSEDVKDNYVNLYVAINEMDSNKAQGILKVIGDVFLIKKYNNCFTKQDYSAILLDIKNCINDESYRYKEGKDCNMIPADDCYTILDLITDLANNKAQLNLEALEYNRTSAKTEQKTHLDEIERLKGLLTESTGDETLKLINEIKELEMWTPKFESNQIQLDISNIVFNESRPNISIQGSISGHINLSESKKTMDFNLPEMIDTFITRNYTIVKDGIVNVKELPVKINSELYDDLKNKIDLPEYNDKFISIDLTKIPLINRKMVKTLSAKEYFNDNIQLLLLKAKQKVYKYYLSKLESDVERRSGAIIEKYGEECATQLDSIGLRSYGFTPPSSVKKSGDFYIAKELNIKIAGASSLPSIDAVEKKVSENKKLNLADMMIKYYIDEVKNHIDDKSYLKEITNITLKEVRTLQNKLNRTLYSIILGKVQFNEFDSLEEGTMEIDFKYNDFNSFVKCTAELKDTQITI